MRISSYRKLEGVVAKDTNRPGLTNPFFDGKTVTCTDGKTLLSFVPDEIAPDDTPGIIPMEILKLSRAGHGEITLGKTVKTKTGDGVTHEIERDEVVYPEWQKFFPKSENCLRICINAKLLYDLAQAGRTSTTYNNLVILNIPRDKENYLEPIEISFPELEDKAFIMPCRL